MPLWKEGSYEERLLIALLNYAANGFSYFVDQIDQDVHFYIFTFSSGK